jgi:surface-anchored protein
VRVNDASILNVPDDPAYDFLGLPAGTPVHVVPQTQKSDVAWMGWNTQEPQFMSAVTGGVTLTLEGVQGPGDVVVYLQNGNFGAPDVLWNTRSAFPQDSWVEINTHTHANWTFSEPGVYLAKLSLSTETLAGEPISTEGVLRFAVGDSTDAQEAFAATYAEAAVGDELPSEAEAVEAEAAPESSSDSTSVLVAAVVGAVVVALAVAITVILITGNRAKRKARERRTAVGNA